MKQLLPLSFLLSASLAAPSAHAQRPTQPARNLVVSAAVGSALVLQFTPGNGVGRTLTMARAAAAGSAQQQLQPRDSTAYPISADYGQGPKAGSGFVVANTPLDMVVLTGLTAANWYQLQVTEYAGYESLPLFAPASQSLRVVVNSSSTAVTTVQAPTLNATAPVAAVSLDAWPNPVQPGEEVQVVGPQNRGLAANWISASGQQLPAPQRRTAAGVAIPTPARPGLYLLRLTGAQGELVATARIHVQF